MSSKAKAPKCPVCERTLINRLVDYCQYCETELPSELILSTDEKEALKSQIRERLDDAKRERDQEAIRKSTRGVSPFEHDADGGGIDIFDD